MLSVLFCHPFEASPDYRLIPIMANLTWHVKMV